MSPLPLSAISRHTPPICRVDTRDTPCGLMRWRCRARPTRARRARVMASPYAATSRRRAYADAATSVRARRANAACAPPAVYIRARYKIRCAAHARFTTRQRATRTSARAYVDLSRQRWQQECRRRARRLHALCCAGSEPIKRDTRRRYCIGTYSANSSEEEMKESLPLQLPSTSAGGGGRSTTNQTWSDIDHKPSERSHQTITNCHISINT